jgi:nucleoside-diphosphate-sugar epimerase
MNEQLSLVVTGASGFIGRHFVMAAMQQFKIYCLARRSQAEVDVPHHPNIVWIQTDIGDVQQMAETAFLIRKQGRAEVVLHLAGYYDFSLRDHPAYEKTNVQGTRNTLDLARNIGARHFIFSSSLAACAFTPPGAAVSEATPLTADFPYARSKRQAEAIITDSSQEMPASIVRLAAVFSDWCEYPPLYSLLETWLSKSPLSCFTGGRGQFSLPYIHIKDVIKLFLRLLEWNGRFSSTRIYLASPAETVSHQEIFYTACRYFYNKPKKLFYLPQCLTWLGIGARYLLSRILGMHLFERPWMARYLDSQLSVDPKATYEILNWKPTPRLALLRRLLFIIENKKIHTYRYQFRNQVQLQRFPERNTGLAFSSLSAVRDEVMTDVIKTVLDPSNILSFFHCQRVESSLLKAFVDRSYQLILLAVRTRDRSIISEDIGDLASGFFEQGFSMHELVDFMSLLEQSMIRALEVRPELESIQGDVSGYLELTLQYCVDEIRDVYEQLQDINRVQTIQVQ